MSNNRRNQQTTASKVDSTDLTKVEGAEGTTELTDKSTEGNTVINPDVPVKAITPVKQEPVVKSSPAPIFASKQAPTSNPRAVKMFKELLAEYAKDNTTRQMDEAKARQVTRGLCTAFNQMGKVNANDVKVCLQELTDTIRNDSTGAFAEGVMFRHAMATSHSRLYIDMLNLAKRYVSLGDGKANIGKVVDVDATAEHYTSKVVQTAIVDYYK